MKRFLSIMLTVMLVFSSFVMVSAEEPFKVIEVNNTTKEYSVGSFTGNYEISADIYVAADATSASVSAALDSATVATTNVDVATKGEWQTVKVAVYNASFNKINFTAEGTIYVNNIKVGRVAGTKTLVFEEDFEDYEVGANVNAENKSKWVAGSSDFVATTSPMTEFTVKNEIEGNDTKVGNIFQPNYVYATNNGSGIPTYRTDDEGKKVASSKIDTSIEKPMLGEEYYNITLPDEAKNADHLVVEFDVYNAANAWNYRLSDRDADPTTYDLLMGEDGTPYAKDWRSWVMDQLWFSIAESSRGINNLPSHELPTAKLEGDTFNIQGRNETGSGVLIDGNGSENGSPWPSHNANVQTWNKVRYEVKREQYVDANGANRWHVESKLTFGGATITNHTYSAAMSDMGKLIFSVDKDAGGRFYIDNLNVYKIEDIDDSAYVTRFEEDFEGMTVDSAVTGFDFADPHDDGNTYSTFTVKQGVNGNATKSGRLYNNAANRSDITRKLEDGTADTYSVLTANANGGYGNMEWFTINLPGKYGTLCWGNDTTDLQTVRKLRLQFKYYLPESIVYPAEVKDNIQLGFTDASLNDLMHVAGGKTNITPVLIEPWTQKTYFNVAAGRDMASHSNTDRKWIPVTVDFTTKLNDPAANQRFTTTIAYNGAVSCTRTHARSTDLNKFYLGLNYTTGGIAYIDDIVISTPFEAADFGTLENKNVENVYSVGADIENEDEEFVVKTGSFGGEGNDSVNIYKMPGETESIQVVAAIFKDSTLYDAVVTPVTTPLNAFEENTITLAEKLDIPADVTGYKYKVFVFNSIEGLKPLADMLETPAQ